MSLWGRCVALLACNGMPDLMPALVSACGRRNGSHCGATRVVLDHRTCSSCLRIATPLQVLDEIGINLNASLVSAPGQKVAAAAPAAAAQQPVAQPMGAAEGGLAVTCRLRSGLGSVCMVACIQLQARQLCFCIFLVPTTAPSHRLPPTRRRRHGAWAR